MNRLELEDKVFSKRFSLYDKMHKSVEKYLANSRGKIDKNSARKLWAEFQPRLFQLSLIDDTLDLRNLDMQAEQSKHKPTQHHLTRLTLYIEQARSYSVEIEKLTDEELLISYQEIVAKEIAEGEAQAIKRDKFAFFNLPESKAASFWMQLGTWTEDEAIALSFGRDPLKVNPKSLMPYRKVARSIFTEMYEARLLLLRGAIEAGVMKRPLRPSKIRVWAKAQGEVFRGAFELGTADLDDVTESEDTEGRTTRQDVFYSVLLFLLIEHYGYDVNKGKGERQPTVFANLIKDLSSRSLGLTAKPLRDHAHLAKEWAFANGKLKIKLK